MNLRAPWDRLADCVWLARLADKIRLQNRGKLPHDYVRLLGHPRGIDGHFLRHFGLNKENTLEGIARQTDDAGVEQWFRNQAGVSESIIQSWNQLAPNLGRTGWPGEAELAIARELFYGGETLQPTAQSLFDLIRIDESLSQESLL